MTVLLRQHRRAGHQRPGAGRRCPLGLVRDAALVVDERPHRLGRPDRPGAGRRRSGRLWRCERAARIRRQPRAPGLRRRPGRRVRRADGRRSPTTAAASRRRSRRPAPRPTTQLSANVRPAGRRAAAQGVTTFETKSGYGLTVADEARVAGDRRAQLTAETTFLGAHVVPAEYRDRRDDYVGLVAGACWRRAHRDARWIDVFCDRGAFDVDEARTILQAGGRAGLRSAHARRPARRRTGRPARRRVGRGVASTTARTPTTATSTALAASRPPSPRCCRAPSSPPARRGPTARRLLDAGVHGGAGDGLQPRLVVHHSMPFCIALAVREMRLTPAEALGRRPRAGAPALAPRRRRRARARHAGRLRRCSTHPHTFTWPTGPECPSSTTWCNPALPRNESRSNSDE